MATGLVPTLRQHQRCWAWLSRALPSRSFWAQGSWMWMRLRRICSSKTGRKGQERKEKEEGLTKERSCLIKLGWSI